MAKPVQNPSLDGLVINHADRIKKLEDLLRSIGLAAVLLASPPTLPGEVVIWTGTEWIPIEPPWLELGAPPTAPGEIIIWNGTEWLPEPLPIDLSMYLKLGVLPSSAGQVPTWDGTAWIPEAAGEAVDIGDYTLVNAATDYSLWGGVPLGANGIVDDLAAIQAAIDYCALQGGGEVLLPAGKPTISFVTVAGLSVHARLPYRITNKLFVRPGVMLKGQGQVATQIWADFSVTNNWDAVQVGEISGSAYSYGTCGVRDLSIVSGLGFGSGSFGGSSPPVQATDCAGLITGKDNILLENVWIGHPGTNVAQGIQVKNPIVDWGSEFDTGALFDMSTDGTLTCNNVLAVGQNQGMWLAALSGSLGCPAAFNNCGGSAVNSSNSSALRVWWAQGVQFNNFSTDCSVVDILIDPPDDGGPFPGKIRGSFIQGLDINFVNSYSFPDALVLVTPIAAGSSETIIQQVTIDGYANNGLGNSTPAIVISKRDSTGADIALGSNDNFQDVTMKNFWVNGIGVIGYIGACQGASITDCVFPDPVFGGSGLDAFTIGAHANHATISRNKLVRFNPNRTTLTTGEFVKTNGVTIQSGAQAFVVTENDFDPIVVTTPINDLSGSVRKVVANNM